MRLLIPLTIVVAFSLAAAERDGVSLLESGEVDGPGGWTHTGGATKVEVDREQSAADEGCLIITNEDREDDTAHGKGLTITSPDENLPSQ